MDNNGPYPWNTPRRFNAYIDFIRKQFGERIQKLSINAGFSCPNRDGTKSTGGCSYCNNQAFSPAYCSSLKPVKQQIEEGIAFHKKRYRKAQHYFAYFQSFSNTWADVSVLRQKYEPALEFDFIRGINIGTRPDCLNEEILEYLEELNSRTFLTVEFGIESCYDHTLQKINRGHDFSETRKAFHLCAERGIRTGGHLIVGLPGESPEDIIKEAEILSELPVKQLKFHQLQIVKGTAMALDYQKEPNNFRLFGLDEYLDIMRQFLERLSPEIIIERIAGETMPDYNMLPGWGLRYDRVLAAFEKLLEEKDSWQGKYYKRI